MCLDSQAALKTIGSSVNNSNIVDDCLEVLSEVGNYKKLSLLCVSGHEDHPGNELADTVTNSDMISTKAVK